MACFEKPEIKELIQSRNWAGLREKVSSWRVPDIADLLADLEKPDRVLLFRCLPRTVATEVFLEFETPDQENLLAELTDEETRSLLADLAPDDRTDLLEELPGQATQRLMNLCL
jgi:magnesium transporter